MAGFGKSILLCQNAGRMHYKAPTKDIALVFFKIKNGLFGVRVQRLDTYPKKTVFRGVCPRDGHAPLIKERSHLPTPTTSKSSSPCERSLFTRKVIAYPARRLLKPRLDLKVLLRRQTLASLIEYRWRDPGNLANFLQGFPRIAGFQHPS